MEETKETSERPDIRPNETSLLKAPAFVDPSKIEFMVPDEPGTHQLMEETHQSEVTTTVAGTVELPNVTRCKICLEVVKNA